MSRSRHTTRPRARLLVAFAGTLGCALLSAAPASARVVAVGVPDNPGSTRVAFTVDAGCNGAPTTGLRVRLPARAAEVIPQAPAGWTVERVGDELVWSGGPAPADRPATFVVAMRVPGAVGDTVHFPTVQRCGTTEQRWTEPVPDAAAPAAAPRIDLAITYLPEPAPPAAPTLPRAPETDGDAGAATTAVNPEEQPSRVPLLAGALIAVLALAAVVTMVVNRRGGGAP